MKTEFSEIEIAQFLNQKKHEIQGDNLLLEALSKPDRDNMRNMYDAFNQVYQMGYKQGELQGRIDMMNALIKLFEL